MQHKFTYARFINVFYGETKISAPAQLRCLILVSSFYLRRCPPLNDGLWERPTRVLLTRSARVEGNEPIDGMQDIDVSAFGVASSTCR